MRRGFVVFVLLAMMAGLHTLKAESINTGADPLTLAAIGFVVLAAFAIAELGAKLSLPKVTGFIVSGVVLGPFVGDVITSSVVEEMRMFSTLALGLIAITAGLELDLTALRRSAMTLSVTVAAKIIFCLVLVGGSLFGLELAFGWLGIDNANESLALAFVFSALAIGTSPAIAIAIIEETKSKGRLSELVLGAAVLKDVVVVVCLAIAVAVARVFVDGSSLSADVMVHVGKELLSSIVAGACLGGLLIAYLRFVQAEMLLFVAATVLVVAEISSALHLELLLVFIVAGFVVRNFSRYEHDLLEPLQTVSLPVFIVFFTNAGASVDLNSTFALLPMALALCFARALSFYFSGCLAGLIGRESKKIGTNAWLGYLPQAGVTLGLIGLAAKQLPQLSEHIMALGMAVVSINLLVGPITLRGALTRVGDIRDPSGEATESAKSQESAFVSGEWPKLNDPALVGFCNRIQQECLTQTQDFVSEVLLPWIAQWRLNIGLHPNGQFSGEDEIYDIAKRLDRIIVREDLNQAQLLSELFGRFVNIFDRLDNEIEVSLDRELRVVKKSDPWWAKLRKRQATILAWLSAKPFKRKRTVPVRLVARTVYELRLARAVEDGLRNWQRYELRCLESFSRQAIGLENESEVSAALEQVSESFVAGWIEDIEYAISISTQKFAELLSVVGSPAYPDSYVRYSTIEASVERSLVRMKQDGEHWPARLRGAVHLVQFRVEVQQAESRMMSDFNQQVVEPTEDALDGLKVELQQQYEKLADLHQRVSTWKPESIDESRVEQLRAELAEYLPKSAQKRLRTIGARIRRSTSARVLSSLRNSFVGSEHDKLSIVSSLTELLDAERPAQASVGVIDIRELKEIKLSETLMPKIEEGLDNLWKTSSQGLHEISECIHLVDFVLSSSSKSTGAGTIGSSDSHRSLLSAIERSKQRLEVLGADLPEKWKEIREDLEASIVEVSEDMNGALASSVGVLSSRVQSYEKTSIALKQVDQIRRNLDEKWQIVRQFVRDRMFRDALERLRGASDRVGRNPDRFDAVATRQMLKNRYYASPDGSLPALYPMLYSATPLRDPRFFATHRQELSTIVNAERAWRSRPSNGNAIMICGNAGSGKSSLLTIAEIKLSTRRIVTIRGRRANDEKSFTAMLARELGCEEDTDSIVYALTRSRGSVIVDDFQDWFAPTLEGVKQFEAMLGLIIASSSQTLWIIAGMEETFSLFEAVTSARSVFVHLIRLAPLSWFDLQSVVSARQQLSGLKIRYQSSWKSTITEQLLRRSPSDAYFRRLLQVSGGSLRMALNIWLLHATLTDEETISMRPISVQSPGLPVLRTLNVVQLAILSILMRHGSRRESELAEYLGESSTVIGHHVYLLFASGLIRKHEDQHGAVSVPPEIRDDIGFSLGRLGLWAHGVVQ